MATPNYGYEKRQRELAKKQKKEEKLKAKSQRKSDEPQGLQPAETADSSGPLACAESGAADAPAATAAP